LIEMQNDLSGIILCGGLSKRMGRQKSFLPYGGKTLIENSLDLMSEVFSEVVLVSNNPADYEHLSAHVVRDIIPNRGPLVGILSGLLVTTSEYSFVLPCDMPFVGKHLVQSICARRHESDLVVYSHAGRIEPLLGVYSRSLIPSLEEAIFRGKDIPMDFIVSGSAMIYDYKGNHESELRLPHFNVDTPADYGKLCGMC
jgi:molybdopterin-guanine dinucleotide biosynthesis protein A